MKLSIEHRTDYPKRINPFLIMKEAEKLFGLAPGSTIKKSHDSDIKECRAASAYVARCLTDWEAGELADHYDREIRQFNMDVFRIRDEFSSHPNSALSKKVLSLLDLFSEEL